MLIRIICLLLASASGCSLEPSDKQSPQNVASVQTVPPEYFGLHIHHAGAATAWPEVPFSKWRLWDAYVAWPSLEPSKGQWRFQTLDKYVALAEQHNIGILLPLGLTPRWASARPFEKSAYQPGNAAEPNDIGDWRDYVKTVASRYKGRIREYEIWNEPNSESFWTGDVNQMIDLTREASQIIHEIDADAKIVSPSATTMNGVAWLAEFLAKGGGQYVDVIGFHFYVTPHPPETMVLLIREVKRVMKENGAVKKPLWNTETGWSGPKPFPSPELAAAYLVRAQLLAWANGVQRFYWYAWDNHSWVTLQTTEKDNRTLTDAGKAYASTEKWLVGSQVQECGEDPAGLWICTLDHHGIRQWIAWSPSGTREFESEGDFRAREFTPLFGSPHFLNGPTVEVGQVPILLSAE
jgi:hypothetical protein